MNLRRVPTEEDLYPGRPVSWIDDWPQSGRVYGVVVHRHYHYNMYYVGSPDQGSKYMWPASLRLESPLSLLAMEADDD